MWQLILIQALVSSFIICSQVHGVLAFTSIDSTSNLFRTKWRQSTFSFEEKVSSDGDSGAQSDEVGTGASTLISAEEEIKVSINKSRIEIPLQQPRPTADLLMKAMGTSPRRIFLSSLSATGIALTGNLYGVTSNLLTKVPESLVESTGLDTYYPRGDFKRFRSSEGYTFVIPKEWVGDTALELAKIERRTMRLDAEYNMKSSRSSRNSGSIPDAAFGPPNKFNERGVSSSDTNVSSIVSKLQPGLSLRGMLGSPTSAAETLLRVSLTPEGSGRVGTLIQACEEQRGSFGSIYQFEYRVDRGERGPPLKSIAVIAVQGGDTLVTMTVVAPEKDWGSPAYDAKLRKIAESFKLTR